MGKHLVTVHGAPRGRKTYKQWGATWFPKGIVYDTAISNPVPRSLQHDTFHLGVGRPEPFSQRVSYQPSSGCAHHNCSASHVNQVEYESTIPRGTDEGLYLWDALCRFTEVVDMCYHPAVKFVNLRH